MFRSAPRPLVDHIPARRLARMPTETMVQLTDGTIYIRYYKWMEAGRIGGQRLTSAALARRNNGAMPLVLVAVRTVEGAV